MRGYKGALTVSLPSSSSTTTEEAATKCRRHTLSSLLPSGLWTQATWPSLNSTCETNNRTHPTKVTHHVSSLWDTRGTARLKDPAYTGTNRQIVTARLTR